MENIKRWFENDYENYEFTEYDGQIQQQYKSFLKQILSYAITYMNTS